MTMQIWTYANLLTATRIVLSPVFIVFFFTLGAWGKVAAFVIACLFEITDALDGFMARSRGEVSGLGKLMDPLADSISRFSVFLCLLAAGYVDVWMIAIIFYRDAMVSYLRVGAATQAVVMAARVSGKIKAVCQGIVTVSITLLIAAVALELIDWDVRRIAWTAMIAVAGVTLWSGIDYLLAFARIVRGGQSID
jgi:CDP-diacylglycerol--glycerol-3-phosphate 3-phosphatidyltransferase